jgi:murein DD-endopeptidase MepM/ murein hydrolase activator NlpD
MFTATLVNRKAVKQRLNQLSLIEEVEQLQALAHELEQEYYQLLKEYNHLLSPKQKQQLATTLASGGVAAALALLLSLNSGSFNSRSTSYNNDSTPFNLGSKGVAIEFNIDSTERKLNSVDSVLNGNPVLFERQGSELNFADKVRQVAANIGADPVDLLTLMSFESAGTLSPSQRGPYVPGQGRAVGLIQFMPATAAELGATVKELARMSATEQLDYVGKYLVKRGFPKGGTLKQLYSTVFAGHPYARGSISDGYHTLDSAVERMNREHRSRAIAILNGDIKGINSVSLEFSVDSTERKLNSAGSVLNSNPVLFEEQESELNDWTAEDKSTPAKGEKIAGYEVTSPWGNRKGANLPAGASTYHRGTDVGLPEGTPVYAIAEAKNFRCWWDKNGGGNVASFDAPSLGKSFDYLHLSSCNEKTKEMRSGNTGIDGGAHLHLTQRNARGEKEPAWRGFIRRAIQGKNNDSNS